MTEETIVGAKTPAQMLADHRMLTEQRIALNAKVIEAIHADMTQEARDLRVRELHIERARVKDMMEHIETTLRGLA